MEVVVETDCGCDVVVGIGFVVSFSAVVTAFDAVDVQRNLNAYAFDDYRALFSEQRPEHIPACMVM